MCQTLEILHTLCLLPNGPSRSRSVCYFGARRNGLAPRVARPEAVGLARTNRRPLDAIVISSFGFMDTVHLTTGGDFLAFELHLVLQRRIKRTCTQWAVLVQDQLWGPFLRACGAIPWTGSSCVD
jgi:hypothetical protein